MYGVCKVLLNILTLEINFLLICYYLKTCVCCVMHYTTHGSLGTKKYPFLKNQISLVDKKQTNKKVWLHSSSEWPLHRTLNQSK